MTLEGKTLALDPPFMVLATQNPIEQEGTYPLPESELDRFLMEIRIAYPDQDSEHSLVRLVTNERTGSALNLDAIEPVVDVPQVLALQQCTAGLLVDDQVLDYAVRLVRATRERSGILHGAGPRASIALVRAAKGRALLSGNDFATPDHVKQVAHPVLRHRLRLTADLEIDGTQVDDVIGQVLDEVEAPRV